MMTQYPHLNKHETNEPSSRVAPFLQDMEMVFANSIVLHFRVCIKITQKACYTEY